MKSVLISIQPFWCGKIAAGKKTAEIRKSLPKVNEPFRCYIYCTKDPKQQFWRSRTYTYVDDRSHNYFDLCGNGKVIGEFICGGIIPLMNIATDPWDLLAGEKHQFHKQVVEKCALLTEEMLKSYACGRRCYAWEIEKVTIYDKPKPLSEFGLERAPQSWCYVKEVT